MQNSIEQKILKIDGITCAAC
ncbi:MAG: hypothetical protein K0Q47_218, partial [Sedimentibacter sp.]|nr:hypothetical protein [Sedimentibacter sp.]